MEGHGDNSAWWGGVLRVTEAALDMREYLESLPEDERQEITKRAQTVLQAAMEAHDIVVGTDAPDLSDNSRDALLIVGHPDGYVFPLWKHTFKDAMEHPEQYGISPDDVMAKG